MSENNNGRATVPGRETPIDAKAAAVAGLLVGKTQLELAEELGLSQSTISRIDKSIPKEYREIIEDNKLVQYQVNITNLVQQNLEASLLATIEIANLAKNGEWLEKQNAKDVAALYSSISNQSIRVLGALERAEQQRQERIREERERSDRQGFESTGDDSGDGAWAVGSTE